jgi:RNA polymerase sigma-70 factor (ECF subfamily)
MTGAGSEMTETEHFEEFMRAYQNLVFSVAMRMLGNQAEAEDVSQEVFLKAYERFGELRHSPTVAGWLKTVTTNMCLNHLSRYRARWRFFSEMTNPDESDADFAANLPAPDHREQEMTVADQRRLLEAAMQKLPDAQRVPLVLYHFEDMSYEAIAARLKVSLAKVKTDIHRAREALRRRLRLDEGGWVDGDSKGPVQSAPEVRWEGSNLASMLSF